MKKSTLTPWIFVCIILFSSFTSYSQRNEWVNQVITVNSGKYESTPPYNDYVTVQTYNPVSQQSVGFGIIYTQSAQDVVISGKYAYVAAGDSIIKYNLDNYQRVVAKADSGISKLFIYNDRLILSKQGPIKRFFVEVLDATNLSLIARIQNISGDCGGITANGDSIYVAVPGTYGTPEGKLAVIPSDTWLLSREINLGPDAVGIWNLYNYNGHIFSVNRTIDGGPQTGSISRYTLYTNTFTNTIFEMNFGDGIGIKNNFLYLNINHGIGSINLTSLQITDPEIVPDPGFVNRIFITSAGIEYVDGNIYVNVGNRISNGTCKVYSSTGDLLASYNTGINTDALAFDYRTPVSIENGVVKFNFRIFPNPVQDNLWTSLPGNTTINNVKVTDLTGRAFQVVPVPDNKNLNIDCSGLNPGIYFLTVQTSLGKMTHKFIKN